MLMGCKIADADCHWLILYPHHYFVFPGHRHQIEVPTLQVVYTTVPSVMQAVAEAAVRMVAWSIQLIMLGSFFLLTFDRPWNSAQVILRTDGRLRAC